MLKRTIGRYLLTVLVITGLAGTTSNNSLSKPERKKALAIMKDTRTELLAAVKELNSTQLNFQPSSGAWSIKDCIDHIALAEKMLWKSLETAMKEKASPSRRAEVKISDEELIRNAEDPANTLFDPFKKNGKIYRTADRALASFKNERGGHIKYLRTSTEDLRNHIVQMPFGAIDCYQLVLLIASHSNRHYQQILTIKNHPHFPQ